MYVTNCIPGGLAHNFIGTDDAKLHSFDTGQVGRRECTALVHGCQPTARSSLPAATLSPSLERSAHGSHQNLVCSALAVTAAGATKNF
jgi:hypothetical protein